MGCARWGMTVNLISPHRKVPGLRTPKPFIFGPKALSHSLRVGNTRHSGTRTFFTEEGPTTSSTNVPLDNDELNSASPNVGQLGLAVTLQKHRLPSGRTGGIGMPRQVQPVAQGRLHHQGRSGPQGSHLRNLPEGPAASLSGLLQNG
jgi:hypothetical protein